MKKYIFILIKYKLYEKKNFFKEIQLTYIQINFLNDKIITILGLITTENTIFFNLYEYLNVVLKNIGKVQFYGKKVG